MIRFNPLDHPISLATPQRLTAEPAWHQHIPFAFALIDILKPRLFVELGTYRGDSFCAFCQAVSALQCGTTCVAVDSWLGDVHVGRYGSDVYEELCAYQREHYSSFASLLRSTFDSALAHFEDASIDLLHIDGTHTYEAVKHDFEQWLGKMSSRGVVLLHDIHEHLRDFGVFQLWKELKQQYPTCEFSHGHGLGVVATGAELPEGLLCLLQAMNSDPTVAWYFQILGERITHMQSESNMRALRERVESLEMQASSYAGELAQLERARDVLKRQCSLLQIRAAQGEAQREAEEARANQLSARVAELDDEAQRRDEELREQFNRVATLEDELQKRSVELGKLRSSRTFRTALLMQRPIRGTRRLLGQRI
ncbi:MAG TPA: class I SAM-dependent methyltransferase [Ktedonobacterales bacterium]|nr:class I SAM-dependent methyltransferase [Ktedonobacterales bacterium]